MENRQSFTTARGFEYSYFYSSAKTRPTILFLHGFPSHATEWSRQFTFFADHGYGYLAPDLLGFGHSSKPSDGKDYSFKLMADDVAQLLDSLGLDSVIGVGHDLGANFLGKLAAFYPSKLSALVFLSVGSGKPAQPFDIDMIHAMTRQFMGHELFGYIKWLGAQTNPHETLEKHENSVMSLLYTSQPEVWNTHFHPLGKFQSYLESDETVPVGSWYTEKQQAEHAAVYGKQDGYKGATRWYQMMVDNSSLDAEKQISDVKLTQPALFIGHGEQDPMSGQQVQMLSEWVPGLKVQNIASGHWVQLEQPEETNKTIESFLSEI